MKLQFVGCIKGPGSLTDGLEPISNSELSYPNALKPNRAQSRVPYEDAPLGCSLNFTGSALSYSYRCPLLSRPYIFGALGLAFRAISLLVLPRLHTHTHILGVASRTLGETHNPLGCLTARTPSGSHNLCPSTPQNRLKRFSDSVCI